jgi:hypothetical protein
MNNLTIRRLRPLLRFMPRSTRSDRHRVLPCDLPAGPTMSTPLDRSSSVPLCVLCIEAGRATEATHQTRDQLCGCDQHIRQLEQHGRTAIHRQRSAWRYEKVEAADELDRWTSDTKVTR